MLSPAPIVNWQMMRSFSWATSIGERNTTRSGPTTPRTARGSARSHGGMLP